MDIVFVCIQAVLIYNVLREFPSRLVLENKEHVPVVITPGTKDKVQGMLFSSGYVY